MPDGDVVPGGIETPALEAIRGDGRTGRLLRPPEFVAKPEARTGRTLATHR